MPPPRLTFGQFIGLSFLALTGLLVALLSVFYAGSRRTILLASEQLMRQASRRVTEGLDEHLGEAERLVAALESQAALGLVTLDTVEAVLLGAVGGHPHVTDVTLTYGAAIGTYERDEPPHDAGDLRLAPERSGQISVSQATTSGDGTLLVRRLRPRATEWRAEEQRIARDGTRAPAAAAAAITVAAADPTTHPTFTVPSRPEYRGRALWSDLSFYEAVANGGTNVM